MNPDPPTRRRRRRSRRSRTRASGAAVVLLLALVLATNLVLVYRTWRVERALVRLTAAAPAPPLVSKLESRAYAGPAQPSGVEAERVQFGGRSYDLVRVDLRRASLGLYWRDSAGGRFGSFERLVAALRAEGKGLVFATNAGMFTPEGVPVGLHVEEGVERAPLRTGGGTGNFYLRPNGVFFVGADGAGVMETAEFARRPPGGEIRLATQSGPLLLHRGSIHPAFREGSRNLNLRSGVCAPSPREVVFAISNENVSFHELAVLFRDHVGCRDALYLDGAISKLYSEQLQRYDSGGDFTGILAVAEE